MHEAGRDGFQPCLMDTGAPVPMPHWERCANILHLEFILDSNQSQPIQVHSTKNVHDGTMEPIYKYPARGRNLVIVALIVHVMDVGTMVAKVALALIL